MTQQQQTTRDTDIVLAHQASDWHPGTWHVYREARDGRGIKTLYHGADYAHAVRVWRRESGRDLTAAETHTLTRLDPRVYCAAVTA